MSEYMEGDKVILTLNINNKIRQNTQKIVLLFKQ